MKTAIQAQPSTFWAMAVITDILKQPWRNTQKEIREQALERGLPRSKINTALRMMKDDRIIISRRDILERRIRYYELNPDYVFDIGNLLRDVERFFEYREKATIKELAQVLSQYHPTLLRQACFSLMREGRLRLRRIDGKLAFSGS